MGKKQPLDYSLVQLGVLAAFAGGMAAVYRVTEGAWQALAIPGGLAGAVMVLKLAESMIDDIQNDD